MPQTSTFEASYALRQLPCAGLHTLQHSFPEPAHAEAGYEDIEARVRGDDRDGGHGVEGEEISMGWARRSCICNHVNV